FTSLVLFIGGNVVLGTLISLRLDLEGVSENLLGIVLAFYSLGFIVGATFCVSIIREVGHIRAFAAFAAIACAATLLHPIWVTPESWRSAEHTSELQSRFDLVCRLLLDVN